jgi:glycine/D-amino acid oxidase-like deaminating enzyme
VSASVVGAGISGLSIARSLLERGLGPVTVYDGAGIGSGASALAPGGIRQQWGTAANCAMARESYAFYLELEERLGAAVDASFDACGYLFLADRRESLAQLEASVRVQHQAGVPSALLTTGEVGSLVPALDTDGVAGASYCAQDGYFDHPQEVVAAFARAARALGARFEQADVRSVDRDGNGWRVETAHGARHAADAVVIAAAAETAALVAPLGATLPIGDEPRFLFLGEPTQERVLEPLVIAVDRGLAAKQLADGRLLASDLRAAGDPAADADRWRETVRTGLERLVPGLASHPLTTLVAGTYDMTPDAQPIIDEIDDNLWVAAGFSGHGFMVAPSTGRLVAAGVGGDELPGWHDAVRAGRFRETERDTQVI